MTWPDWIWCTERPSMGLMVAMAASAVQVMTRRRADATRGDARSANQSRRILVFTQAFTFTREW